MPFGGLHALDSLDPLFGSRVSKNKAKKQHVCVCVYIYIYIYIQRERERERERATYLLAYVFDVFPPQSLNPKPCDYRAPIQGPQVLTRCWPDATLPTSS